MLFLIGSILLTSWLTLFFKIAERWKVSNFQVIVFNYICCVITGSLFNGYFPITATAIHQPWFTWALVMGLGFIITFNIMGITTQQLGVSVASVAFKLSLVIPFIFSLFLYNEPATAIKLTGVALALLGVYLTLKRSNDGVLQKTRGWIIALPLLLFAGSGLVDTMIKYTEQRFLNGQNNNDFLITAFASAATVGSIALFAMIATGRQIFQLKAVMAGILLGVPNYFSIWCLMVVLKQYAGNSSAIIPINNMGIVLFSALAAWLLFKEKLSAVNWLGILLSVVAIALIAFG